MSRITPPEAGRSKPGYTSALERLRQAYADTAAGTVPAPPVGDHPEINPTLKLLTLAWKHLVGRLGDGTSLAEAPAPEPGEEIVLIWKGPRDGVVRARVAGPEDLLALKVVVERIDLGAAAARGATTVGTLDRILHRAADAGLLLPPRTRIRRPADFPRGEIVAERFLASTGFTLQWHLTQACDLHCRHCYDRSPRAHLPLASSLRILEDLHGFCRQRRVRGAVSFSGGNPLLHPDFLEIYRAADAGGFTLNILGNPTSREWMEQICAVRKPSFFQVSLEGLPEQNDRVRGPGHFDRTVKFLGLLKELDISSMVMLTLTADNIGQVLPLAQRLRGLVDDLHFNRLARVGEGSKLRLPDREAYARFLRDYLAARADHPSLGIKDNLINILLRERGAAPFGGCTGFGCGAAFNFIALLADGEAHACRKFPSLIGNVLREGIAAVYDSPAAAGFRAGCDACRACPIRPVCGGCLAVAYGFGLDVRRERDPLCFLVP